MKLVIIAVLFVVLMSASAQAQSKCPEVKFAENFDHKRFLGKWYGIQTTGIDMACGSYELFETDNPKNYRILLQPPNVNVELIQKGSNYLEGFTATSSLEFLNNVNMRVYATDYDNYAVVVECKDLGSIIFLTVSFGSRTKTLDNAIIEKLKLELTSKYGIDLTAMKIIDQTSCY